MEGVVGVEIGVDGETTTTTATVRYADARGLEGARRRDFWVTADERDVL